MNKLLLVLFGATLATLAFLLFPSPPGPPGGGVAAPADEAPAERPVDVDGVDPDVWLADAPERAASGERVALAAPSDAPRAGPVLHVVDAATGASVVAAEVRWVEPGAAVERQPGAAFLHPAELAERFGAGARTDVRGRVALPPVVGRLVVVASHEGRFGARLLDGRHRDEEQLALVPDRTLAVRVEGPDGAGQPSVPIGVFQELGEVSERARARGDLGWRVVLRVVTDARGIAVVPHFQLHERPVQRGGSSDLIVAVLAPMAEPALHRFAPEPWPDGPIELRIGATGRVVARVRGPDGAPFANRARVTIAVAERAGTTELGEPFDRLAAVQEAHAGAVELAPVGVGLVLRPRIQLDDDDFTWDGPAVTGPSRAGETVEVDLPMPDWIGLLAGRLVDGDGAPHGRARPTFLISGRAGRIEGEDLGTDTDGRFELPFRVPKSDAAPYTLEVRDRGDAGPIGALRALQHLPPGRTELGELTLLPLGLVASGRVVDDRGVPLGGARVELQREREVGDRREWRDESYVDDRTDDEGRYTLFGDPWPGRLRLRARAAGHLPTVTEGLVLGSSVDLVLTRSGSIAGRVELPAGLGERALRVAARPRAAEAPWRDARLRVRGSAASWRCDDLAPGSYDFAMWLTGFPEPVVELAAVPVEPGANDAHPLAQVDLRDRLFPYRLTARDDAGALLADPGSPLLVRLPAVDGSSVLSGFPWRNGRLEFFAALPSLDVVQLGTGTRPVERRIAFGDTELGFARLAPVTLTMPGVRALCGTGRTVRVSMVLLRDTGMPMSFRAQGQLDGRERGYSRAQLGQSSGAWLGDGDTVSMPLMRDGRYRVVLRLYESGVDGPASRAVGDVDVALGAVTSPRLHVPVDPAAVQDALAELRRRRQ